MHNYCQKCVYPIHAVNLDIDEAGICSACRTFDEIVKLDDSNWLKRKEKLVQILDGYKKITEGD